MLSVIKPNVIPPRCSRFEEKHLIRGQQCSRWSPYNSWQGHYKGATMADASHINFQLMDIVALLQLYLQPHHYDCQGHIWWKHDEAAVYLFAIFPLAHSPSTALSLSLSSLTLSFSWHRVIEQWGDQWVLITRGTVELIEHCAGPNFTLRKSRCWLCKFCPVPLGDWRLLPDTKVILFPVALSCCLCNLPEGLFY